MDTSVSRACGFWVSNFYVSLRLPLPPPPPPQPLHPRQTPRPPTPPRTPLPLLSDLLLPHMPRERTVDWMIMVTFLEEEKEFLHHLLHGTPLYSVRRPATDENDTVSLCAQCNCTTFFDRLHIKINVMLQGDRSVFGPGEPTSRNGGLDADVASLARQFEEKYVSLLLKSVC